MLNYFKLNFNFAGKKRNLIYRRVVFGFKSNTFKVKGNY